MTTGKKQSNIYPARYWFGLESPPRYFVSLLKNSATNTPAEPSDKIREGYVEAAGAIDAFAMHEGTIFTSTEMIP
jgi:hypothetical protein